jgi:hypothetical protein
MYIFQLVGEVYPDKEAPLELLTKYDLEQLLEKAILKIKLVLENPPVTTLSVISLAPSVLLSVNARLKNVPNLNHKRHLEMMIADIASHLIEEMIKKSNQPASALKQLKTALKDAAELEGYDFNALLSLLRYKHLEETYVKDKPVMVETYWLAWKGKPHELDYIAKKLSKKGWIKSTREFRHLFEEHNDSSLKVMFAREGLHFLLVLFDELKSKKLIVPKGCNGHFHPLKVYAIDFDKNVLIISEPKLIKAALKKDSEKLQNLREIASEWLRGINPITTSKLPLASQRKMRSSKI